MCVGNDSPSFTPVHPQIRAIGPLDLHLWKGRGQQLPAGQATALRLTLVEGLSLWAAAERVQISAMAVQRAQKKAIAALRQQLAGGG